MKHMLEVKYTRKPVTWRLLFSLKFNVHLGHIGFWCMQGENLRHLGYHARPN